MFSRAALIPLLLAASVGIPYVASNGPDLSGLWPSKSEQSANKYSDQSVGMAHGVHPPIDLPVQGPGAVLYPTTMPLEGMPSMSLHEIFRFDISKEWVYHRWARKSTALAELGLYGIRVPLVSGTKLHDLAGSLTYFFGEDGRLQRISFVGRTGDSTQLVMLLVQRYGLVRQATPVVGEQVFQIRRKDQVFSEMRTRPAPVLWASTPHDSFSVELHLQRPDVQTPLPPRNLPMPQLVSSQPPTNLPAPPAEGGQAAPAAESVAEVAEEETKEPWKAFFPRSRVPKPQVDSLDRRERYW